MATLTKRTHAQGFTLIGVLVAMTILIIAVVALSRLLVGRGRLVTSARHIMIATNLSREGLELVRAVRDTNWYHHTADWAEKICPTDPVSELTIDSRMVRFEEPLGSAAQAPLWTNNSSGEYTHTHTPNDQYKATPFSRTMTVDCAHRFESSAYIEVASRVTWTLAGRAREVEIKERLYNWYDAPRP